MFQVREDELVEFTCCPGVSWLWGLFALLLCPVFTLVLVRHRYIRLDGPAVTSRA